MGFVELLLPQPKSFEVPLEVSEGLETGAAAGVLEELHTSFDAQGSDVGKLAIDVTCGFGGPGCGCCAGAERLKAELTVGDVGLGAGAGASG